MKNHAACLLFNNKLVVAGGNNANIGLAYAQLKLAAVGQSVVELLTQIISVPGDGNILAAVYKVAGTLANKIYLKSAVAIQNSGGSLKNEQVLEGNNIAGIAVGIILAVLSHGVNTLVGLVAELGLFPCCEGQLDVLGLLTVCGNSILNKGETKVVGSLAYNRDLALSCIGEYILCAYEQAVLQTVVLAVGIAVVIGVFTKSRGC